MNEKEQAAFDALPRPPAGSSFSLVKVETVCLPHPYMIGSRHVGHAADHFGGRLGKEAIADAERKGIYCEWRGCQLSYDKHESQMTAFIEVGQNRDLNAVPGLHAYLLSIKEQATQLGIDGFAFPLRGQ